MASAHSSTKLTKRTKASEASAATAVIGMADVGDTVSETPGLEGPKAANNQTAAGLSTVIDSVLNLLSAVRFGIVLLILLIITCMIGMLIQQQELESFPAYYAELTPAEKTVYGRLGFFDIYHVWYFNLLLLLLSLNIILASIDHFPKAWSFITRKKLTASPTFAMAQKFKEKIELPQLRRQQLVERATEAARKLRFKVRVTEEDNRATIFAERGVWNRLGAYVIHIGLLTIFFGGFMTSRGFTGMMQVRPDQSSDRMVQNVFNIDHANTQHAIGQRELALPFTIEGLDIQQKLINKAGSIDAGNTLDWLTRVNIVDHETGRKTEALIHMNTPFDYRGYRFFQASFNPLGSARTIKLKVTPANGSPQEISIRRNGETKLSDGTRVRYLEFNPHFIVNADQKVDFGSTEYQNPAAHLAYVTPSGEQGDVWAFTQSGINQMSNAPFLKSKFLDTGAFQFVLTDFEKAPFAHTLSIQYDPGARIVYIGFTILCLMLVAVFFFSHQRLWIVVEDGNVYLGGNSNRNRLGFEDRAKKLAALIREPHTAS
jgi:cytochrome c biogenesis protein